MHSTMISAASRLYLPRPALSATIGLAAAAATAYPRHTRSNSLPITKCESNRESSRSNHPTDDAQHQQLAQLKKDEKSCVACLVVGMATCTGLSIYFVKLASEVPDRRSKAGFLTVSCFWAGVGMYRWHIG